ncbi:MAG: Ku protein [Myxococcales bacterium]
MARALWSGSISFGLVNVPVRLYAATDSHQLEFHQFDARSGKRVRYKRVAEGTDHEVPYDQIVDGYEVRKGKLITLTDEEMAAAEPKKTRTLDIEDFVPLEAIDPIAWSHTYYVGPDASAGAQKAYAVLREAMKQTGRVGVGRFVMRSKEYLAIIRPLGKVLALETMFFEDEIRGLDEVPGVAGGGAASPREMEMAKKLIEALATEWKHGKYKDTYRDELLKIIKQKAKGDAIALPPEAEQGGQVIDLMEALKKSLAGGGRANPAKAAVGPAASVKKSPRRTLSAKAAPTPRTKRRPAKRAA